MIKKIGILTSGGDAPGMNAALVGAIRTGYKLGKEMYVVYDGYKGLVDNNFVKVDEHFAEDKMSHGGTVIKTARLPEFKEEKVRQIAVNNLKNEGIEALIVVGGDGSYMGAKKLTEMGINCVGLPGTIDNDIASTDFTIGFDTSLNNICSAIDKIVETMSSHNRCVVVEVMGNNCPDLTLFAGIACNADYMITVDRPYDEKDLMKVLKEKKAANQDHVLVLVAEKILDVNALAKKIMAETGWDTRADILGYIQRGGTPSAMERFNAVRMGAYAVELLDQGIGGVCVGLVNNKLTYHDIIESFNIERNKHEDLYHVFDLIK